MEGSILDELELKDAISNAREIDEARAFGIQIHENLASERQPSNVIKEIDYNYVRDKAVRLQLVPKNFSDAEINEDEVLRNFSERNKIDKLDTMYRKDFDKYMSVWSGIITSIRAGSVPIRSYLIGAPLGLGSVEFANRCIIEMVAQGHRAVPLISLMELGAIRAAHEKAIEKPLKTVNRDGLVTIERNDEPTEKVPELITGRYSFSEYMNADCLFVAFTSVKSKEMESHLLKQVLNIRGMKGLPTIALMDASLQYYRMDKDLNEYVWKDIITNGLKERCYEMIYHVSCYRVRIDIAKLRNVRVDGYGLILSD